MAVQREREREREMKTKCSNKIEEKEQAKT